MVEAAFACRSLALEEVFAIRYPNNRSVVVG